MQTFKVGQCDVHDFSAPEEEGFDFDCVSTSTHPNVKICIFNDDEDIYVSKRLRSWGAWERHLTTAISQLMGFYSDPTFVDIGANLGIMTVHLARKCDQGHVHAIEPIPENFVTLGAIVKRFRLSNVTLHQFALGEQPGELEMVMPEVQNVKMHQQRRLEPRGGHVDPVVRRPLQIVQMIKVELGAVREERPCVK